MTPPQHTHSPSFPPHNSHSLIPTRSLPSYPDQARPTHPQHGTPLSDDYGRTSVRHYRSASSSPYRSTTQLPHHDQAHFRHRDHTPYSSQVSPRLPPSPPSQDPHSISPQLDKFAQASARYECVYCGKAFNRPSSLRTHTNTHTGEKRTLLHHFTVIGDSSAYDRRRIAFVCPHPGCGRAFSVQSNMRRHARVHDTPRGEGGDSSPDDGTEDPPSSR